MTTKLILSGKKSKKWIRDGLSWTFEEGFFSFSYCVELRQLKIEVISGARSEIARATRESSRAKQSVLFRNIVVRTVWKVGKICNDAQESNRPMDSRGNGLSRSKREEETGRSVRSNFYSGSAQVSFSSRNNHAYRSQGLRSWQAQSCTACKAAHSWASLDEWQFHPVVSDDWKKVRIPETRRRTNDDRCT